MVTICYEFPNHIPEIRQSLVASALLDCGAPVARIGETVLVRF